jgi:TM2 domain-containing membrane protein YozV
MSIVPADKKIPAGILAILLGSFGVHKFFLGYPRAGMAMLIAHGVGWLMVKIGILGLGFLGTLLIAITGVIALIEGIIYLTRSDNEFYRNYIVSRRPWF